MLIRFKVANFLSFRDEVEFSMVAGTDSGHPDHIIEIGEESDDRILKTGIVYGANAAGKSNLVKALKFAQDFIVSGSDSEFRVHQLSFMLDPKTQESPSKFEFEIECKSGTYIYGFEVDRAEVYFEFLRKVFEDEVQDIFTRGRDASGHPSCRVG